MTRKGTATVFQHIVHDRDLAGEVATGDFTNFADEELTDAERALLRAAAGELDGDVEGFTSFPDVCKVPAPPAPMPIPYPNTSTSTAFRSLGPGVHGVFGHIGSARG